MGGWVVRGGKGRKGTKASLCASQCVLPRYNASCVNGWFLFVCVCVCVCVPLPHGSGGGEGRRVIFREEGGCVCCAGEGTATASNRHRQSEAGAPVVSLIIGMIRSVCIDRDGVWICVYKGKAQYIKGQGQPQQQAWARMSGEE